MANEVFTTYTEVDIGNYLTVTALKASAVAAPATADVYLYKDYGANHFDALDIDFELFAGTSQQYSMGGIGLSNTVDDFFNWAATDIVCQNNPRDAGAPGVAWVRLGRGYFVAGDYYIGAINILYYCTLSRVAGSDTATVTIYSDAARAVLLDTLIVAGFGTIKWRYSFGYVNPNSGDAGRAFTGYTQNMNLNIIVLVPGVWDFATFA